MLKVLQSGLMSTVQDLGRGGYQADGVPESGAVDPVALRVGNRLVGNPAGAAALELTLLGGAYEALVPLVVALTGADLGATLAGRPAPRWEAFAMQPGQVLRFTAPLAGCRCYLAVAGGIAVPEVLGSRSTDLLGKLGLPPLKEGDLLPIGPERLPGDILMRRQLPLELWPAYPTEINVRVVPGPQTDAFEPQALPILSESVYSINPRSDRMGCRLDGPTLPHRHGADIVSDGMPLGGIQVPPDGKPIVLLQGRQTMGGYTKIGVVISPDVARIGQLPLGGKLRFQLVSREEAHLLHRVAHDHLTLLLDYCR